MLTLFTPPRTTDPGQLLNESAPKHGMAPATSPLSYRQLKPTHGPRFQGWYCKWVVWLNLSSWSMRNGSPAAVDTVAPAPPIWGWKKRAATLEKTMSAEKPWISGTLTRPAYPGILELCHSMGNVIGVLPSTLKSYPLCVYFEIHSPEKTRYLPNACSIPAWNSLRKPGLRGLTTGAVQRSSGAKTALPHPMLESIRFSLKGDSRLRA